MALFEFLKLKKKDEISNASLNEQNNHNSLKTDEQMEDFNLPELPELPPLPPEKGKKTMHDDEMHFAPPQIPEEIEISTKQYRQELPLPPSPKKSLFSMIKKTQPEKQMPLPKPEFQEDFEESNMEMPEFDFPSKPMMTQPLEDVEFEKKYLASRKLNIEEPRFVKAQKYGKALEELNQIRRIISETDGIMLKFTETESKRMQSYNNWQKQLEDIQRKLMYVDKTLFK